MNKYAKYLQRIKIMMENLDNLHRFDTLGDKLPGYEREMDHMLQSMGKSIDERMAREINRKLDERRKNVVLASSSSQPALRRVR